MSTVKKSTQDIRKTKGRVDRAKVASLTNAARERLKQEEGLDDRDLRVVAAQKGVEDAFPFCQHDLLAARGAQFGGVDLAVATSLLHTRPPFQLVSPIFGAAASARTAINAAAVLPVTACNIFPEWWRKRSARPLP